MPDLESIRQVLMLNRGGSSSFVWPGGNSKPVRFFEAIPVTDCSDDRIMSGGGYWRSSGEIVNHQQAALLELEFLISTFGGAGQVVVLCCETGSGCVAALRLGRDTTGINNSPFQLNEVCRRLKQFGTAEAAEIACRPQKRLQDRAEELPEVERMYFKSKKN